MRYCSSYTMHNRSLFGSKAFMTGEPRRWRAGWCRWPESGPAWRPGLCGFWPAGAGRDAGRLKCTLGPNGPWRAARGGALGRRASDQGRGMGGEGLVRGGGGGIPQRQARTVAETGATDKRVESQRQARRQRDCPSPKGRLQGGRRRRDERRQGEGRHLVRAAHTQPGQRVIIPLVKLS